MLFKNLLSHLSVTMSPHCYCSLDGRCNYIPNWWRQGGDENNSSRRENDQNFITDYVKIEGEVNLLQSFIPEFHTPKFLPRTKVVSYHRKKLRQATGVTEKLVNLFLDELKLKWLDVVLENTHNVSP